MDFKEMSFKKKTIMYIKKMDFSEMDFREINYN